MNRETTILLSNFVLLHLMMYLVQNYLKSLSNVAIYFTMWQHIGH
jgi:hypothetical protein